MITKTNVVSSDNTPCSVPDCSSKASSLGSGGEAVCPEHCRQHDQQKEAAKRRVPVQDLGANPEMVNRHK